MKGWIDAMAITYLELQKTDDLSKDATATQKDESKNFNKNKYLTVQTNLIL